MIEIKEHPSSSYAPRTKLNAKLGDITVAFYIDDTTAGERLTKSVAGKKYIGVSLLNRTPSTVVKMLYSFMEDKNATTINIAGNGIYTLNRYDIKQHEVNIYIMYIIKKLHQNRPITKIFSGGQTGVDLAGIVAAKYLEIPGEMTLPKGYIQRFENGLDVVQNKETIEKQLDYWFNKL